MKNIKLAILSAIIGLFLFACTSNVEHKYSELKVAFSSDSYNIGPNEQLMMPYTITGVEDATIEVKAVIDDADVTVEAVTDDNFQGNVVLTSPVVIPVDKTAKVSLTVTDAQNKRQANATAEVVMSQSEPLVVNYTAVPRTLLLKGGDKFKLEFVVKGLGEAQLTTKAEVPQGWSATVNMIEQLKGQIEVVAPSIVPSYVEVKILVEDNFKRKGECAAKIEIIQASDSDSPAANSFIVKPGSTFTFEAFKGNSSVKVDFDNAKLVWQDKMNMVKSVATGTDKIAVVLNPNIEGNAVIAAYKGDLIVWSWHLWVTSYDPEKQPMRWTDKESGETHVLMDRNLGSETNDMFENSSKSYGLLYQWGRKDPFVGADDIASSKSCVKYDIDGNIVKNESQLRPVYDNDETTNLELSINNPNVFYYATGNLPIDWLTNKPFLQDNDLWGGKSGQKTMYDPCPAGWRVPDKSAFGFRKEFGKLSKDEFDDTKNYFFFALEHTYDNKAGLDNGFIYSEGGWSSSNPKFFFPLTGYIDANEGYLMFASGTGMYHTRNTTQSFCYVEIFAFYNPSTLSGLNRPYGCSIRCEKIEK